MCIDFLAITCSYGWIKQPNFLMPIVDAMGFCIFIRMSKIREYPKRMLAKVVTTGLQGFEKRDHPSLGETVYNQTAYDSYIRRWSSKFDIDERSPTWKELQGNWIERIWYKIPNWILIPVSFSSGVLATLLLEGIVKKALQ